MEKKFRKLELIEVPMSELEQSALDEILAGWSCGSFHDLGGGHGSCSAYTSDSPCGHCDKYSY